MREFIVKKIIRLASCFLGLLLSEQTYAHPALTNANIATIVQQTIEPWMKQKGIPGAAINIYREGKPSAYYFGVESRDTQHPINEQTIFAVGSWTKVMTCLLAAETADAGLWELNDSVIKYLPLLKSNESHAFQSITLKNLGTYTAGLPFNLPETIQKPSELSDYLNHWRPEKKNTWAYSNVSIGLLGDAVAARNQDDIEHLYIQKILKPLGMQPIGFSVPENLQSHYAQGYDVAGKPAARFAFKFFPASGAAKMSAGDALKFLKAAIEMSDVDNKIAKAMKVAQTPYFNVEDHQQGLGWIIYPLTYPISQQTRDKLLNPADEMDMGPIPATAMQVSQQKFDGSALMDKTGAADGFRSYIVVIPNLKTGVVILVNRYVSNGEIIKIGREILLKVLDDGIY
jgi:beta-lactamase class C